MRLYTERIATYCLDMSGTQGGIDETIGYKAKRIRTGRKALLLVPGLYNPNFEAEKGCYWNISHV